jgi:hypothetical protein
MENDTPQAGNEQAKKPKKSTPFREAEAMVRGFRRGAGKDESFTVLHSAEYMMHYFTKIFPALKEAQDRYLDEHAPAGFPRNDYEWQVGFYWMKRQNRGANKLDFFMVPTLVKKEGATEAAAYPDVIDYYDPASTFLDKEPVTIEGEPEPVDYSIDNGTLRP